MIVLGLKTRTLPVCKKRKLLCATADLSVWLSNACSFKTGFEGKDH